MLKVTRKITDVLVTILFAMLVIVVFVQVVCRTLRVSFPYADEISRYTFIWLIYLGGSITVRNGMNITFDVILDALPKKAWKVVFSIVNIISCVFLALVVYLGANLAWVNRVQSSSVVKLNMGMVMLAIPVGGLLMFFEQISYWIRKMKEADQPKLEEGEEK